MVSPKARGRLRCNPLGAPIAGLFIVQGFLFVLDRFSWLRFNHDHKGWAVLTGVAIVASAAALIATWTAIAAIFRWRIEISVRSLLALVVVAALTCSWLAVEVKEAKEQESLAEAIREVGGGVAFDYADNVNIFSIEELLRARPAVWPWLTNLLGEGFFANVTMVSFLDAKVTDTTLERLDFKPLSQLRELDLDNTGVTDAGLGFAEGLTQLQHLSIRGTGVTNAGLVHLRGLTRLRYLDLSFTQVKGAGLEDLKGMTQLEDLLLFGTSVTDGGLAHLRGLKRIRRLYLGGTAVTGDGLEHLEGCQQLQELDLKGAQITDVALVHLEGLTQLQFLTLDATKVTDAGLEHLKGLSRMRALSLDFTQVTDEGVKRFQHALPKCQISHQGGNRSQGEQRANN